MLLSEIAETSRQLASTRSRLKKQALLSDCLQRARKQEVAYVVSFLSGELPHGKIGVGPSTVRTALETVSLASLSQAPHPLGRRREAVVAELSGK